MSAPDCFSYFSGLRFMAWNSIEDYTPWVEMQNNTFVTLQYNHSGPMLYKFDDQQMQRVEGPHAWLSSPYSNCCFGCPTGTSRHHEYVSFWGPRIDDYIASGLIPAGPSPMFRILDGQRFHTDLQELYEAVGASVRARVNPEGDPRRQQVSKSYEAKLEHQQAELAPDISRAVYLLEGLLLQLKPYRAADEDDLWMNAIQSLAARISTNPEHPWDYAKEASNLHVSLSHFRRIFPQYIGIPPDTFLRESRLLLAAKLLRTSTHSLEVIAERCGIPETHHFSRLFKQYFNIAPGSYRKATTQPFNE